MYLLWLTEEKFIIFTEAGVTQGCETPYAKIFLQVK